MNCVTTLRIIAEYNRQMRGIQNLILSRQRMGSNYANYYKVHHTVNILFTVSYRGVIFHYIYEHKLFTKLV